MTVTNGLYIAIVPILVFGLLLLQSPKILKKLTLKNGFFIFIALAIMGFAIYDGCDKFYNESKYEKQVSDLQDRLNQVEDTLIQVKDTLVNIGLSIDEKTGKLLVMDSQLLKKEFTNVFNVTQNNFQPASIEIPDSENYTTITRNDSLFIFPKKGTWVHAYYAHDTANSAAFVANFTEGMGTANEADRILVKNKIYFTHIWKIYDRAVYRSNPIRLNMTGYKNRYIIFGDEGIPSKRWIYQSGKVTWIPEE